MSRDGSVSPGSAPYKFCSAKLINPVAHLPHKFREAKFIARVGSVLVGAAGLFVWIALASFHPADLRFLSSEPNTPLQNLGGAVGAWLAFVGRVGFGWTSFIVPILCGLWAVRLWRSEFGGTSLLIRTSACVCLLAALSILAALGVSNPTNQVQAGGTIGYLGVQAGRYYLGATGTALLAGCVAGLSWLLITNHLPAMMRAGQAGTTIPRRLLHWLKRISQAIGKIRIPFRRVRGVLEPSLASPPTKPSPIRESASIHDMEVSSVARPSRPAQQPVRIRSTVTPHKSPTTLIPVARSRQVPGGFQLPPIDLLTTPPPISERQLGEDVHVNAKILIETLKEFGIEANCVNVDRGPTVTRYELAPAPGVKLTKIMSLADDLALVLKAASCHIIAPIPGKGLVGVEVPNSQAAVVYLKEIITSREFSQLASPLALGIGKDVSGHPVVCDLRDCPHLLVAGVTGSGKTVCLNSLLTGILYHASPDEVKFLMIDPKMVELSLFNDIPHLVAPVVTNAKRAAAALAWAVAEMERRYQLLAKTGVRNIDAYNQKAASAEGGESRLPYLVVVIDELADLMMVASQDVEEAITRLSQLSRAVGIHIILATQRPSVDVITGVIKANFPARIAFQVASKVDSRTILDMNGADKLLGRGDLLFL